MDWSWRLFEGVNDGAAGNGFVVHHEDVAGGNFLFFGRGAAAKKEAEKIHAGGNGAEGGGVDALRFFVKFLEQRLDRVGHLGDWVRPAMPALPVRAWRRR